MMKKVNESKQTIKETKAELKEILGLEEAFDKELLDIIDTHFIRASEKIGEKKAKEALDLAQKAINMIDNIELKGLLVTCCLSRLPILLQKTMITAQDKMMIESIKNRLMIITEGDLAKGEAFMKAAIQIIKEDKD